MVSVFMHPGSIVEVLKSVISWISMPLASVMPLYIDSFILKMPSGWLIITKTIGLCSIITKSSRHA